MNSRFLAALAVTVLCGAFSACSKKSVAAAPPPAPYKGDAQTPAPARSTPSQPAPRSEVATNERSRMPDAATRATIQELLNRIQDAYFDYDKHTLRPDAEAALKRDAQTLSDIIRQYPDFKLTVEGHCDARGSEEYNLALGDARAKQAKEYLATLGLPADQLQLISYGKDRPVCNDQDEECWQKNRRAHLTQAQ
ncbi:MAG TPA: OmpA family protein [Bryobacteraceae bacterium]|jgi:peptidoglycan-associated lipoprotein|nr:OmpA family protein [Bryobacteraceae bacterium]